ncbi:hypothetical protein THRCLA_20117 [Thraustotheca clavata]|uniref:EF-hand domain-containing protein n=1 Tax=Thraustotheca clavata TaxID=74557 RepID=A0A1W0ABC5_9STRA|nr:hypothetical protein THRCLA_20117 [Thraustotheca clavata]
MDDDSIGIERDKQVIAETHPSIHIETKKLSRSASIDLYCLLFNAQGDLVEHLPFDGSLRDYSIIQEARNQNGHYQKIVIALDRINLGVDVIGLIMSHGHDMVFDPNRQLDDFMVRCTLVSHASGDSMLELSSIGGKLLCDIVHRKPSSKVLIQNAFVVAKLYRDNHHRHQWLFDPINEAVQCTSHCIVGLTRAIQLYLVDIIPDIEIPNVTSLKTIQGICSALTSDEFLALESLFPKSGGINKNNFAECLALGMVKSRPELRTEKRTVALLKLLCEMFDQIDINGDGEVDWEEFTSFCVALGMISTKQSQLSTSDSKGSGIEYGYKQFHSSHPARTFSYHISKMRCFEPLRKVAVLELDSPYIAIFDMDGTYLHDITNVAKSSIMKEGLYIFDIDYIPSRNAYVIASSDRILTLWNIVNGNKGQYVQSGRFVSTSMMMTIKWCPNLKLCMTATTTQALLWNLDTGKVEHRLTAHKDLVTDIIELPTVFITCSYDHKIAIWELDRMRVIYEFQGHTQGVLHLDCIENVLVSCGFEHHARVWSLTTRKQLVMLTGHHQILLDAKLIRYHAASLSCVTGDVGGNFKVWDISRCIVDASKDAAIIQHIFAVTNAGCASPIFHAFMVLPQDHKQQTIDLNEVWTGTTDIVRIVPEVVSSMQAPAQHVLYNALAHTFTASVGGKITVWSGKDGCIIQEPITISSIAVCGLCYDLPRQRKLFASTSDGYIHMYNLITGMLMNSAKVHDGDVLTMIYCEQTNCLITNGGDDSISICADVQVEAGLDPLRTIESVHRAAMTSCAYSSQHGFIATGDVHGHIRVHDFQKLSLSFRCEGHQGEVTALSFHNDTCVLFAGDSTGAILVWQLLNVISSSQCVMRLAPPVADIKISITALCALVGSGIAATDDSGKVHFWPLPLLRKQAKGLTKIYFEPLPPNMIAYARGGFNPNLRMTRMQSVGVALSSVDTLSPHALFHHKPVFGQHVAQVKASMSWIAHANKIVNIAPLPFPGFVFTLDEQSVKLWNVDGDCVGVLEQRGNENKVPTDNIESPKWNYRVAPSNTALEMSVTLQSLAKSVLDKIATIGAAEVESPTSPVKHRESIPRGRQSHSYRRCSSLVDVSQKNRISSLVDKTLDVSMAGILQKAIAESAFSRQSLLSGLKDSTFTQMESVLLEDVSHDEHAKMTYNSIMFPPLLLSKQQLRRKYAQELNVTDDMMSVAELPMLRTCDAYLDELQLRKEKLKRFTHTVDVNPSEFLEKNLSTPTKHQSKPRPVKWKLDTFVEKLPSVSLPRASVAQPSPHRLTRQWNDPTFAQLDARLESSLENYSNEVVQSDKIHENIKRKMALCQNLQTSPLKEKQTRSTPAKASPTPSKRQSVMEMLSKGINPFGPHYSAREVLEFGDTLQRFDKDLSGDIDIDEWLKIMMAFIPKAKAHDVAIARDLFATVDSNNDGLISHQELLHIVFLQASKEQLMFMEEYIRTSQSRGYNNAKSPPSTSNEDTPNENNEL